MLSISKNAVEGKQKLNKNRVAGDWDNEQKARNRAANAYKIGAELENVAFDSHQEAKAIISRMFNADPKANGVLHNFADKQGREYECPIGFEFAYWRLSDSYQIKQAKRHRNTIYTKFMSRMDDIKDNKLKICFFTPTYPNLVNVGFEKNSEFHARAWELFLRDSTDFFLGGYSRIEFTEKSKTGDISINYHNHVLTILIKEIAFGNSFDLEKKKNNIGLSKLDKQSINNSLRIGKLWTVSVKKAYQEIFGKRMKINTLSGNCRVDFKEVDISEIENHDSDKKKGVLFELAGYSAKQANFVGLLKNTEQGAELLAEAEYVFRNKRILTGFGIFKAKASAKNPDTAKPLKADAPLLSREHTVLNPDTKTGLSDSEQDSYQTQKSMLKVGIEMIENGKKAEWVNHLEKIKNFKITERINRLMNHFPNAIFTDLLGQKHYGENVRNYLAGH